MKALGLALLAALLTSQHAFAWGAVEGRYGGAAYRGPYSAGVRTPSGAAAVRGPAGNVAVRGPSYGAYGYGYRPPTYYGGYPAGAAAAGVAAGVAVGAAATAATRPYYPPPYYVALLSLTRTSRFDPGVAHQIPPEVGYLLCRHFLDRRRLSGAIDDRGRCLLRPIEPQHGNEFAASRRWQPVCLLGCARVVCL